MKKTLLLFDIDGTLLQADDATRRAVNRSFEEIFGLRDTQQDVPFAGRTDLGILRDVALALLGRPFRDGELDKVIERYFSLLPGELAARPFRLMPGVAELITMLAARDDVVLGLETGNLEKSAYMKLARAGLDKYFPFGGFGSDSEDRAEFIRLAIARARGIHDGVIPDENIYLVGDSPYDVGAGKRAGIRTIAVCTGHCAKNELLAGSPSCILPDLSDTALFLRCVGLQPAG